MQEANTYLLTVLVYLKNTWNPPLFIIRTCNKSSDFFRYKLIFLEVAENEYTRSSWEWIYFRRYLTSWHGNKTMEWVFEYQELCLTDETTVLRGPLHSCSPPKWYTGRKLLGYSPLPTQTADVVSLSGGHTGIEGWLLQPFASLNRQLQHMPPFHGKCFRLETRCGILVMLVWWKWCAHRPPQCSFWYSSYSLDPWARVWIASFQFPPADNACNQWPCHWLHQSQARYGALTSSLLLGMRLYRESVRESLHPTHNELKYWMYRSCLQSLFAWERDCKCDQMGAQFFRYL